jgi:hypothetical protein
VARKKPEGIEALAAKPEPPSIQEITMLDWFAAFALMSIGPDADIAQLRLLWLLIGQKK